MACTELQLVSRAQTDLAKIGNYSDFMKITVYNNLGGTRMETYITSASKNNLRRYAHRRSAAIRISDNEPERARLRNFHTLVSPRITSIARQSAQSKM